MPKQSHSSLPTYKECNTESEPIPFSSLPFVRHEAGQPLCDWHAPPIDNYVHACEKGREYAAHFIQYLVQNPFWVGGNVLGHIAADIDFKDRSAAKGYWVGFFSHLERFIYAAGERVDIFEDLAKVQALHAKIIAQRNSERKKRKSDQK